jgi:hypothetical protein
LCKHEEEGARERRLRTSIQEAWVKRVRRVNKVPEKDEVRVCVGVRGGVCGVWGERECEREREREREIEEKTECECVLE